MGMMSMKGAKRNECALSRPSTVVITLGEGCFISRDLTKSARLMLQFLKMEVDVREGTKNQDLCKFCEESLIQDSKGWQGPDMAREWN